MNGRAALGADGAVVARGRDVRERIGTRRARSLIEAARHDLAGAHPRDDAQQYSDGRCGNDAVHDECGGGAKGFGEHKTGVPIDSDVNLRVYEACTNLKLPVLFHLDNLRNTDAPGLPGLEKVLKQFPDIPFIGHGPGWWASISGDVDAKGLGGYPKTPVAPGGAMDRLMETYPNIYGDLSAGSGANALSRDMKHAREFVLRRQDRADQPAAL